MWLEILWWIATIVVTGFILFPVLNVFDQYPFLFDNIFFIVIFITYTRYLFLLKHTWIARIIWVKAIIALLSIPLVFFLIQEVHAFQVFLDEQGAEVLFAAPYVIEEIIPADQQRIMRYMRGEMLLFGVGAVIIAVMIPFRMLISIWRQINRGTV